MNGNLGFGKGVEGFVQERALRRVWWKGSWRRNWRRCSWTRRKL